MRLLHTADWQIGMRARLVGQNGHVVRDQRLKTARALVYLAKSRKIDAILVAGDTFEDNCVDRADVQQVADILDAFGRPVYLIPGNHDPAVPGSVWEHPAWSGRIHVLAHERDAVSIGDGVTLYPCPALAPTSSVDPTAWIAEAGGDGLRIGLAHGTVEGIAAAEKCYPIPRNAAERGGLAYLALGHWHSTGSIDEDLASARMAYSGTHEATKFGERDSGNVLIVEIAPGDARPSIEKISTGYLAWNIVERELRDRVDLEAVIREVEGVPNPERTLIEVRLSGLLHPDQIGEIERLGDLVRARFPILGRVDTEALRPEPGDSAWTDEIPLGVLRDVASELRAGAETNPIASQALMTLYRLYAKDAEVPR